MKIIETMAMGAEENMRFDEELLEGLEGEEAILHFYEWKGPSVTYGYFVDPEDYLNLEGVKKRGLDLARRPTGGGIVFHAWDLAFSVLVPEPSVHFSDNSMANYAFVNNAVLHAVEEFLGERVLQLTQGDGKEYDPSCNRFCMARPTKYDVVCQGKKIAGAAQRKRKQGFLHQGTIALVEPDQEVLEEVLATKGRLIEAMRDFTYPLLQGTKNLTEGKQELKGLLKKHLGEADG